MKLLRAALLASVASALAPACHTGCEHELLSEGTEYRVTVVAASAECPEILTLRAGDTLTLRAGPVSDDGTCEGNASTGVPPEFPQYPDGPLRVVDCATGHVGILGFDCSATAPECAGDGSSGGSVRAFVTRAPDGSEPIDAELTVTMALGSDVACGTSCFTKIPITIQRL